MAEPHHLGANTSTARVVEQQGSARWLQQQLQPQGASLPQSAQATVSAMTISQTGLTDLVHTMEKQRKDADALRDDVAKKLPSRPTSKSSTASPAKPLLAMCCGRSTARRRYKSK